MRLMREQMSRIQSGPKTVPLSEDVWLVDEQDLSKLVALSPAQLRKLRKEGRIPYIKDPNKASKKPRVIYNAHEVHRALLGLRGRTEGKQVRTPDLGEMLRRL